MVWMGEVSGSSGSMGISVPPIGHPGAEGARFLYLLPSSSPPLKARNSVCPPPDARRPRDRPVLVLRRARRPPCGPVDARSDRTKEIPSRGGCAGGDHAGTSARETPRSGGAAAAAHARGDAGQDRVEHSREVVLADGL